MVVSDVRMAGSHDGIGAVEVLKKKRPHLKCLIITGYADDQAPVRAIRVNVDDYLYKPFTLDDFMVAVDKVLKSGEERISLTRRLGNFRAAPFGAASDAARTAALQKLDDQMERVWSGLFVAIRSRLLTKGAFVDFWDKLENGRARYQQIGANTPAGDILQLTQAYGILQEQLERSAATRAAGSHKARAADQFSKRKLFELYERVADGRVSAEELRLALALAATPPRGSEAEQLAQRLFGSEP
jgi:CheY-like chemotaxis protein